MAANGVLANDLHGGDDPIQVTEVNGVATAVGQAVVLASGATLTLNANGSYSYDPTTSTAFESIPAGSSTTDSFSYTAADSHGNSDTATVTITVSAPVEPVTAGDDVGAVDEDGPTLVVAANGVLANDLHGGDDPIQVTEVNGVATAVGQAVVLASGATLTLNANGSYSYDPTTSTAFESIPAGSSTTDSFSYTAADSHDNSDTATVTITVSAPVEPVTAGDDVGAVDEDGPTLVVAANGVLANDLHGGDDPIQVTEVNGVATAVGQAVVLASGATLTLDANGSYSYDPTTSTAFESIPAGSSTTDSFSYTAADSHGNSDTATVTITVSAPVEPVTAGDDVGAVDEDGPTLVVAANGVLANDLHGGDDPIQVTEVNGVATAVGQAVVLASGATLTLNANGSYSYDPTTSTAFESIPAGSSTTDSLSYTAADSHGNSDTATVTITVSAPVEPVTAGDDVGAVDEDGPTLVVAANGVLANDLHGGDDPIQVTEVNGVATAVGQAVVLASGATLTLNANGSYSYDPTTSTAFASIPAGSSTTDSFSYTAADSHGNSDTATVTITVSAPVEPVTAGDDVGAVDEDGPTLVVAANGVLANDLHGGDDPIQVTEVNGVATAVGQAVVLASGATLTLNANGSYSYDPTTSTAFEFNPCRELDHRQLQLYGGGQPRQQRHRYGDDHGVCTGRAGDGGRRRWRGRRGRADTSCGRQWRAGERPPWRRRPDPGDGGQRGCDRCWPGRGVGIGSDADAQRERQLQLRPDHLDGV